MQCCQKRRIRSPRHRRPENSSTLNGPRASRFHEASAWPGALTGPQASRFRDASPPHAHRPRAQSNNSCSFPPSTSSLPFPVATIDSSSSTGCVSAFCFSCPLGRFTRFRRSVLCLLNLSGRHFLLYRIYTLPAFPLLCFPLFCRRFPLFSLRPLYYYFIFFS